MIPCYLRLFSHANSPTYDFCLAGTQKAIKSQQTAGVDLNVKSPKALGSVKRKTLSDRSILGKADHAAEHKVLEKIEHLDDASVRKGSGVGGTLLLLLVSP
jgi:hypothetical protein